MKRLSTLPPGHAGQPAGATGLRWALAGVLAGALAAAVSQAPAAWLASAVAGASGGHLWLDAARGTVWNGNARLVLAGGEGSQDAAALPGQVHWRMRPVWAGLELQLHMPCCAPQPLRVRASASWSGARWTLSDAQMVWPASLLGGLGTPWNTFRLDGELALRADSLSARVERGQWQLDGAAQVDALGVSSRLSTLKPMGSYRLRLTGGAAPRLALSTLDGSLQLQGSGEWIGQRLRFRGEASAQPEREAALANLLNLIGRRQGSRSIISIG